MDEEEVDVEDEETTEKIDRAGEVGTLAVEGRGCREVMMRGSERECRGGGGRDCVPSDCMLTRAKSRRRDGRK